MPGIVLNTEAVTVASTDTEPRSLCSKRGRWTLNKINTKYITCKMILCIKEKQKKAGTEAKRVLLISVALPEVASMRR